MAKLMDCELKCWMRMIVANWIVMFNGDFHSQSSRTGLCRNEPSGEIWFNIDDDDDDNDVNGILISRKRIMCFRETMHELVWVRLRLPFHTHTPCNGFCIYKSTNNNTRENKNNLWKYNKKNRWMQRRKRRKEIWKWLNLIKAQGLIHSAVCVCRLIVATKSPKWNTLKYFPPLIRQMMR